MMKHDTIKITSKELRINVYDPQVQNTITAHIFGLLKHKMQEKTGITILCIGTDRSTGDCLGPLIGTMLTETRWSSMLKSKGIQVGVYGTLDEPVHAKNIKEFVKTMQDDNLVIAIDACLGRPESIGQIIIKDEPIAPGTGVNKVLPCVGDISIAGVVNMSGFMEYSILQNTRLNMPYRMAQIISNSLYCSIHMLIKPES